MKESKKIIFTIVLFIVMILISTIVFAGEQDINKLEYNVKLDQSGTAHIEEIWNVYISETNTMFKEFEITDDFKFINPKVEELTKNREKIYTKINEIEYHVPVNNYYGLINDKGKYEIAWGVGLDNSSDTRTYKISYEIKNAVKNYEDCSEFYLKFLTDENSINCDKIIGKIKIEGIMDNIDQLLVWAHGPLNGEINRIDKNTVEFRVDNLDTRTMLETRIVTLNNTAFPGAKKINKNKLSEIRNEEEKFADEANKKRKILKIQRIIAIVITGIVGILILVNTVKKLKKYKKLKRNLDEIEYYRDIPNEETSPSEAAYLFYYNEGKFKEKTPEIISATIMNLLNKKEIIFESNIEINDNTRIKLQSKDKSKLPYLEQRIYELLEDSGTLENNNYYTTMDKFEKYMKKNAKTIGEKIDNAMSESKNSLKNKGTLTTEGIRESSSSGTSAMLIGFIIPFSIVTMIMFEVPFVLELILIIICIINNIIKNKMSKICIDEKANLEQAQWNGLYNYMNDYSLLKEREVLEITLWEKFLVYATAFGIAKKVIKQLKIEYPEYTQELEQIMYYSRIDSIVTSNVRNCTNSYYQSISASTSSYSSGGGYGGGFSSGGGGGRRWRLYGRKIINSKRTIYNCSFLLLF